jgi:hypothetical protein
MNNESFPGYNVYLLYQKEVYDCGHAFLQSMMDWLYTASDSPYKFMFRNKALINFGKSDISLIKDNSPVNHINMTNINNENEASNWTNIHFNLKYLKEIYVDKRHRDTCVLVSKVTMGQSSNYVWKKCNPSNYQTFRSPYALNNAFKKSYLLTIIKYKDGPGRLLQSIQLLDNILSEFNENENQKEESKNKSNPISESAENKNITSRCNSLTRSDKATKVRPNVQQYFNSKENQLHGQTPNQTQQKSHSNFAQFNQPNQHQYQIHSQSYVNYTTSSAYHNLHNSLRDRQFSTLNKKITRRSSADSRTNNLFFNENNSSLQLRNFIIASNSNFYNYKANIHEPLAYNYPSFSNLASLSRQSSINDVSSANNLNSFNNLNQNVLINHSYTSPAVSPFPQIANTYLQSTSYFMNGESTTARASSNPPPVSSQLGYQSLRKNNMRPFVSPYQISSPINMLTTKANISNNQTNSFNQNSFTQKKLNDIGFKPINRNEQSANNSESESTTSTNNRKPNSTSSVGVRRNLSYQLAKPMSIMSNRTTPTGCNPSTSSISKTSRLTSSTINTNNTVKQSKGINVGIKTSELALFDSLKAKIEAIELKNENLGKLASTKVPTTSSLSSSPMSSSSPSIHTTSDSSSSSASNESFPDPAIFASSSFASFDFSYLKTNPQQSSNKSNSELIELKESSKVKEIIKTFNNYEKNFLSRSTPNSNSNTENSNKLETNLFGNVFQKASNFSKLDSLRPNNLKHKSESSTNLNEKSNKEAKTEQNNTLHHHKTNVLPEHNSSKDFLETLKPLKLNKKLATFADSNLFNCKLNQTKPQFNQNNTFQVNYLESSSRSVFKPTDERVSLNKNDAAPDCNQSQEKYSNGFKDEAPNDNQKVEVEYNLETFGLDKNVVMGEIEPIPQSLINQLNEKNTQLNGNQSLTNKTNTQVRKRTFANMVWPMDAEEEKILRSNSPCVVPEVVFDQTESVKSILKKNQGSTSSCYSLKGTLSRSMTSPFTKKRVDFLENFCFVNYFDKYKDDELTLKKKLNNS